MAVSILALYDPQGPAIEAVAGAVGRGIEGSGVAEAVLKSVDQAGRGGSIPFGIPQQLK